MPESFNLDRLPTPIGTALLVTDADGLLRALDWEDYEPRMQQLLRLHYGAVELEECAGAARAARRIDRLFQGRPRPPRCDRMARRRHAVPAKGLERAARDSSRHDAELWRARREARMPNAVRAVGHANGSNPISVVLPCHRLIGANGSLVKYGGGLERKRWLLQHEGARIQKRGRVNQAAGRCA